MNKSFRTALLLLFLLLLAALALFVQTTCATLPAIVASHFDANGLPNGYMPRDAYRNVMMLMIVGVPLLLGMLPGSLARRNVARINIPNRAYWLAPDRVQDTINYLTVQGKVFAALVALFLTYAHREVVIANAATPVALSSGAIVTGLIVFSIALIFWIGLLIAHFARSD